MSPRLTAAIEAFVRALPVPPLIVGPLKAALTRLVTAILEERTPPGGTS